MAMKILSDDEYSQFEKEYNDLSNKENREEELSGDLRISLISSKISSATNGKESCTFWERAQWRTSSRTKCQKPSPISCEPVSLILSHILLDIKIWMLTGDKMETAENIAKSCKLIQGDMTVMRYSEALKDELKIKFHDNRDVFDKCVKARKKKVLELINLI